MEPFNKGKGGGMWRIWNLDFQGVGPNCMKNTTVKNSMTDVRNYIHTHIKAWHTFGCLVGSSKT